MATPRKEGLPYITQLIWDSELGRLSSPSWVNAFATTYLRAVYTARGVEVCHGWPVPQLTVQEG